jgi:cytochrome P450 family 103
LIRFLFVIVAGSDTTRGALAVQTAQLLQHREQWEAVCRVSRLVPGAVAEALRFAPSLASVSRFVLEDIELDGYVLNAGHFMTLSTMAAMRDEKVFEAPAPSTFLEPIDSAGIWCSAVAPIDASVRRLPRRS